MENRIKFQFINKVRKKNGKNESVLCFRRISKRNAKFIPYYRITLKILFSSLIAYHSGEEKSINHKPFPIPQKRFSMDALRSNYAPIVIQLKKLRRYTGNEYVTIFFRYLNYTFLRSQFLLK